MAKVSFYHLNEIPLEKALPKLLEKIVSDNKNVVVLSKSEQQIEHLDKSFWTFSRAFLPHGTFKDPFKEQQPIYLTKFLENPNGATILVDFTSEDFDFSKKFDHVIDMFEGNKTEEVEKARKRYLQYKQNGFELIYWKQNEQNSWVKS